MSENDKTEPLAPIGHNRAMLPLPRVIADAEDLPADVTAFLEQDFDGVKRRLDELLEKAREVPKEIVDDATMGVAAKLVKDLRDLTKEIESHHATVKAPYFRSSQTVDNFFFTLWDKAVRRNRTAKPGAADVLAARIDAYNQRKLAAEQERRRQKEQRLAREAEEKRRQEEEAQRKAEEDRKAADRARKPETREEKGAVAVASETAAATATVEASLATQAAQAAHIDTLARPAELVRTRVDEGPTVTMATEPYAVVSDYDKLDLAVLRPFIKRDALDQALRSWARTTNFNVQMEGAEIGRRPKTVVR